MKPPSDKTVRAFADLVAVNLGKRLDDGTLRAALGTVSIQKAQAGSKLSPVETPVRDTGKRAGPRSIGSRCASTYSSFATCPGSCPFNRDRRSGDERGCFVEANVNQRRAMNLVDASALLLKKHPQRLVLMALAEAFELERAFAAGVPQDGHRGGRDIRLHVAGDAITVEAAEVLAASAARLQRLGAGDVWTFTHGWQAVPRSSWGGVSVLASVETPTGIVAAMARGYAAAVTVEKFASVRAFELEGAPGVKVVPCPAELGRPSASPHTFPNNTVPG